MPLFRRRPQVDPAELTWLRDELTRLRVDLDAARSERNGANGHDGNGKLSPPFPAATTEAPPPLAAPTPSLGSLSPPEPGASLAELRSQLHALAEELSASTSSSEQVRELASTVGSRLDNLASELTNQIDELAGEIEALHQRTTLVTSVTPEAVDALRAGQVRLANEQARYEIAFRKDLAALADELRRPRPPA